jgi:hypothetical protein
MRTDEEAEEARRRRFAGGWPSLTRPSSSSAKTSNTKGRRKKREEGRGPGAGLGSDRPGWLGRTLTATSESDHRRGKFGSRKGRIRAASLLGGRIASGDHVRPTTSRRLNSGGWAARPAKGEGRERDKIKQRVECSEGRGRRGKGTFIVAKRREGRDARSGGLNRKRQRTGNDSTDKTT